MARTALPKPPASPAWSGQSSQHPCDLVSQVVPRHNGRSPLLGSLGATGRALRGHLALAPCLPHLVSQPSSPLTCRARPHHRPDPPQPQLTASRRGPYVSPQSPSLASPLNPLFPSAPPQPPGPKGRGLGPSSPPMTDHAAHDQGPGHPIWKLKGSEAQVVLSFLLPVEGDASEREDEKRTCDNAGVTSREALPRSRGWGVGVAGVSPRLEAPKAPRGWGSRQDVRRRKRWPRGCHKAGTWR